MADFGIIGVAVTAGATILSFVAVFLLGSVAQTRADNARKVAACDSTGGEAARMMLAAEGFRVPVRVQGNSDRYDVDAGELLLCPATYDEGNATSVAFACHEAGHALQHACNPHISRALGAARMCRIACWAGWALAAVASVVLASPALSLIACALWCVAVFCKLGPCLLEADATTRAMAFLEGMGLPQDALKASHSVLRAALILHVVAAFSPSSAFVMS